MDEPKYSLAILGIVAIVAIVIIVMLAMKNAGSYDVQSTTPVGAMARWFSPYDPWPCIHDCMYSGLQGTGNVQGLYKWCMNDCYTYHI